MNPPKVLKTLRKAQRAQLWFDTISKFLHFYFVYFLESWKAYSRPTFKIEPQNSSAKEVHRPDFTYISHMMGEYNPPAVKQLF